MGEPTDMVNPLLQQHCSVCGATAQIVDMNLDEETGKYVKDYRCQLHPRHLDGTGLEAQN